MGVSEKMMQSFSLLIVTLMVFQYANGAAVISIDFGSEWMKVGIVSPGVPMEIVLNKESKRKTPAVVAFRDGVRTFGEDAVTVGVRFPKNSYKYLLDLLGKQYDHPMVQEYMKRYPYYNIEKSERGTPLFVHDEDTKFTPEELVAQLLGKAKDFAEVNHGQQISECVITVPGYFNQAERLAMKDAAALAGLNVLQLINDYTAIAINYGIFRRKEINETAWHALFFDMGAASTKATLVEYKTVKIKDKGYVETVPQMQVIGVGFDRTLGGFEMTLRLREHLIKAWEQKGGGDVRSSPRAMEKLLREAERVKIVLSVNTEHYAQIESLLDDKDFRHQVTRSELEELCSDLFVRVGNVVSRALASAGGAGAGAKVVLAGGAARVPAAQQALKSVTGHEPAKSINADEAATMGAVYRAASLASGYKVAPLNVRDAVILPIQVVFTRNADGTDKTVKRTLFGPMNPYPQKKVITFTKHTDDFTFNINYAELDHIPSNELAYIGKTHLNVVSLSGVGTALGKHQPDDIKGIKAHFSMDDSGILHLLNVELVAETTAVDEDKDGAFAKLGSTISKLFGSDATENSEENTTPEVPLNETKANETETKKNETEAKPKPKIITVKEPIASKSQYLILEPLNEEQFKNSKTKITKLNTIDRERNERESALNSLESFVIDVQMKMDMEEYSECGTPEEIDEIKKDVAKVSEWLYEDGYEASTDVLTKKLNSLKEKSNMVFYKHWEHREREDAVIAIRSTLNSSTHFLEMAKNLTKEINEDKDVFTQVEIDVLSKKIIETETWLNKTLAEQNALKKSDPIKLTIDSIRDKIQSLDREVKYLINKMKIWRPKKPVKMESETNKTEEVVAETPEEANKETEQEKTDSEPVEKTENTTQSPIEDKNEHSEL